MLLTAIYVARSYTSGEGRQALYLTHWNYAAVTILLACSTYCKTKTVAQAAAATAAVSLFVIAARLMFLRVVADDSREVAWDVHTHILVPCLPLVALVLAAGFTKPTPRDMATPMYGATAALVCWTAVNVYAQHVHVHKRWVYGQAANPRTRSGRIQLLLSIVLALMCLGTSMGLSQVNRLDKFPYKSS